MMKQTKNNVVSIPGGPILGHWSPTSRSHPTLGLAGAVQLAVIQPQNEQNHHPSVIIGFSLANPSRTEQSLFPMSKPESKLVLARYVSVGRLISTLSCIENDLSSGQFTDQCVHVCKPYLFRRVYIRAQVLFNHSWTSNQTTQISRQLEQKSCT